MMKEKIQFKVNEITCAGCAEDTEKILNNIKGILDASVSYADDIISITYDPSVIDRRQVFITVRKLGYKIDIITGTS
ncbi:MAG: heavy-metal-associated domain-containing protein [Nitrospiraceae bacterium]|jgi:copper chaperone CopZ|nr:MAG: heavy-metal-associated domain-containing protein [Nitrospiraceae bacterium]